jgi:hypothetical protein
MKLIRTIILLGAAACSFAKCGRAQISWSNQSPAGVTDGIWCVAYANGTFAAVTDQGSLLTSADGLTWSAQKLTTTGGSSSALGGTNTLSAGALISIAYGNGTWVIVGTNGLILVSSDLKTWVSAKAVTGNQLNGVAYGGGVWCAVGDSATVITSPDSLNWTVQPVPVGVTGFLHGIVYAGSSGSALAPAVVPGFIFCGAMAGNGSVSAPGVTLFMPVNSGQVGPVNRMPFASEAASPLEAIFATGGQPISTTNIEGTEYTVIAAGWGLIVSIPDGDNLGIQPPMSSVPDVVYRGLTYGNGFWVAAGEQGTILSSTDGVNWTQRFSGDSPSTLSTATLLSAAYSSQLQRFVVTGAGGTILVSNSPPTAFGNVSTRGYVSSSQTFIGGFVIQGTAPRTVLIRGDGPVLGTFSVPSPLPDPVVTVYDNTGTVVATNTGWSTNTNPSAISTAALEVGAFALPGSSADSALLLTLSPGAYTVQITSAKGNSGIALFEAYTD